MSSTGNVDLYGNAYGHFSTNVLEQVRLETYGEDIGQSGWMTADEYRSFFQYLRLHAQSNVLDICSGSGGPALFMSRTTGCSVLGLDINESGVSNATSLVKSQGLQDRVAFQQADVSKQLPFGNSLFDAIVCIDAIIHLPDRLSVLKEFHRVLKPAGRILYTDPTIITGLVSKEEIAIRSSIGYFDFAAPGEDERLMKSAGFDVEISEDVTDNAVLVSRRWHDGRTTHQDELMKIEGTETFQGLQRFLQVVHRLTSERRLSRFVFVAQKAG
ncbi:MAG TPA: class I SAM-dependent methyltransferase [Blastocatellia bacterium]|nr:class I SAM-dependent methyltransferase [Blastocatellia bacterium]